MKIRTTSKNIFSTFSPRDLCNLVLILFCFDSVLVGVIFLICCLSTTCHLIIMTRSSNGKKTSKYFKVFLFFVTVSSIVFLNCCKCVYIFFVRSCSLADNVSRRYIMVIRKKQYHISTLKFRINVKRNFHYC